MRCKLCGSESYLYRDYPNVIYCQTCLDENKNIALFPHKVLNVYGAILSEYNDLNMDVARAQWYQGCRAYIPPDDKV